MAPLTCDDYLFCRKFTIAAWQALITSDNRKMPIYRKRYPDNWSDIALAVKESCNWRCRHCGKQCLRPGENKNLTRSEWTAATICVHHANCIPEDNRPENLIPLCTPCHLAVHTRCKGNVSPGQLSLFSFLYDEETGTLIIALNVER